MSTTETPSSEVVLRDGETTVMVSEEFRLSYPAIVPDEDTIEMLSEALEGIELTPQDLPRVRVPSGGSLLWKTVVNGKEAALDEIEGIMAHVQKQRLFWSNPEPSNSAPDCLSSDNVRPEPGGMYAPDGERAAQNPSGLCAKCPMSAKNSDLKGGKGSACKEQRLVFIGQKGKMLPTVVVVPPSSIKSLQSFIIDVVNDGGTWRGVKSTWTLEEASNAAGIKFGRIVVKASGKLEPGELAAVKAYGDYIKELVSSFKVTDFVDGNNAADMADPDGGLKVGKAG
jgi:hypothetical protein